MITQTKSLLLLAILSISLSACQKKGCTNQFAENFDADAVEDDGSCTLEREKFLGTYSVSQKCLYENDTTFNMVVTEGPNDNEILLKNFFGWDATIRATVDGSDISFKDEQIDVIFEGTGYIANNEMVITFDACESFYYPCSDPEKCTSTCTKQ